MADGISYESYERYQNSLGTLKASYDAGVVDEVSYKTRVTDMETSFYNNEFDAATASSYDNSVPATVDASTTSDGTTSATSTANSAVGATFQNSYASGWDAEIDSHIANYGGKGGRLTQFVHNDSTKDDERLAYIKLVDADGMSEVSAAQGSNKAKLDAIFKLLTSSSYRYDRFILNSVSENRAERVATIKTVGDSFSVTFSGREPMVIAVSGSLVFDYDRNSERMSWYTAFCNAYEYYLRASINAKYRAKIRFVLPDFTVYEGYIVSLCSNQASDSDMTVPFNFSMLVTSEAFNQSYMNDTTPNATSSNASEYTQAKGAADKEAAASGTVSAGTDGAVVQAENNEKAATTTSTKSTVDNSTAKEAKKKESLSEQLSKVRTAINSTYNVISTVGNAVGIRTRKNSIFR